MAEPQARPKRQKWFTSYPYNTLGILSLTSSGVGLASLGLELLMWWITGQMPATLIGLGIPFISMPLGAGALVIVLIILPVQRRLAVLPAIGAAIYWAVALGVALT